MWTWYVSLLAWGTWKLWFLLKQPTLLHSSMYRQGKSEHFRAKTPAKTMLNLHNKCQGSVLFVLYLRHCPCRHCRLSPLKCRSLLPASPADKRSTSHYYPACICRCHCTDQDSPLCTQKQSTHIREGTFQQNKYWTIKDKLLQKPSYYIQDKKVKMKGCGSKECFSNNSDNFSWLTDAPF